MASVNPSGPTSAVPEDNTAAIVSYIGGVGLIAAIFIHNSNKTAIGKFHLRQSLGLTLTWIVLAVASFLLAFIPFLGWLAIFVLYAFMFVIWIMGLVAAINRQMKPVPVVGDLYQQWFATAFE